MASSRTNPLKGAALMVLAGLAFALANALTQIATFQLGFKAQSDTFWQYAVALVLSLPFVIRQGLAGFRTNQPGLHLVRVVVSALGVQAFVMALAHGVQIWQVIALVMTSPFFVMLGAMLFWASGSARNAGVPPPWALAGRWCCCAHGRQASPPPRCCPWRPRFCGRWPRF